MPTLLGFRPPPVRVLQTASGTANPETVREGGERAKRPAKGNGIMAGDERGPGVRRSRKAALMP
ncbi:MAG: hypothetical protein AAF927_03610 [Bacteroidota bacterium]